MVELCDPVHCYQNVDLSRFREATTRGGKDRAQLSHEGGGRECPYLTQGQAERERERGRGSERERRVGGRDRKIETEIM